MSSGIGTLALGAAEKLASGTKIEGALNLTTDALGIVNNLEAAFQDPIAWLGSTCAHFLIKYVKPLDHLEDIVVGDPDRTQKKADGWNSLGSQVDQAGSAFSSQTKTDNAEWGGTAGPASQNVCTQLASALSSTADQCRDAGSAMSKAAKLISTVRGFINDVICELVGKLISWACEILATWGMGTADVIAKAVPAIASRIAKVTSWLNKLTSAIKELGTFLESKCSLLSDIVNVYQEMDSAASSFETAIKSKLSGLLSTCVSSFTSSIEKFASSSGSSGSVGGSDGSSVTSTFSDWFSWAGSDLDDSTTTTVA
ncbi:MAG: hypothetical protein LBM66_05465 [Bifidobacteriaceae bacterium]|jgi:uncharacterized protein YukE|nr:hypothetical protein [Bifidobacteriaceae bacterium]